MDFQNLLPKERPKLKPCCKKSHVKPWMDGTLSTTYGGDFVGKEVPVERGKPRDGGHPIFGGRFDGTTTASTDYKQWQVRREAPIMPTNTQLGSDEPFQGHSTYRGDFGVKEAGTPPQIVRPQHAYQPSTAPFDGTTTHHLDFQPREVAPPVRAVTHGTSIPTSAGPFQGSSLYKDTFQKQPYTKRSPIAPAGSHDVLPRGSFVADTMYRDSYVPKEGAKAELCRPADARPQSSHGWYGGQPSTEYGGQFVGKEIPGTKSLKPARAAYGVLPNAPFAGTTTAHADYVPYATGGAARIVRPSPALGSDGQMPFTGQSTYKDAFIPKDTPYERVRPKNGFQPSTAAFDATTTHRSAYMPVEVPAVTRAVPRAGNIGQGEHHTFSGSSTYKSDFTKMGRGLRAERVVPGSSINSAGPFDGTTTYKLDFVEKEIPAQYVRRRDDECESCVDGIPGVTCL